MKSRPFECGGSSHCAVIVSWQFLLSTEDSRNRNENQRNNTQARRYADMPPGRSKSRAAVCDVDDRAAALRCRIAGRSAPRSGDRNDSIACTADDEDFVVFETAESEACGWAGLFGLDVWAAEGGDILHFVSAHSAHMSNVKS